MSTISLTYDELAERLGMTGASVRNLVRRRQWKRAPGNDGKARITVPEEALKGATRAPINAPTDRAIDVPSPVQGIIARLELEVAGLRDLVEAERRRADAEAKRADGAEASFRDLVEVERKRADGAEFDRNAWRVQAQRPWWRRLAG